MIQTHKYKQSKATVSKREEKKREMKKNKNYKNKKSKYFRTHTHFSFSPPCLRKWACKSIRIWCSVFRQFLCSSKWQFIYLIVSFFSSPLFSFRLNTIFRSHEKHVIIFASVLASRVIVVKTHGNMTYKLYCV